MRNSLSLEQNKNNKTQVDVLFYYNGRDHYARPIKLTWNNEDYVLGGVQFWYTEHRNNNLVHHYRVSDESGDLTFELSLETENLTWRLEKAISNRGDSIIDVISSRFTGGVYA